MKASPAPKSVADFCSGLNDKSIIVNEEYQRSSGVWKPAARSYFIESVILEYPIPKLFLFSKVSLVTKESVKEIVDGQQRARALQAFYNNELRLSNRLSLDEARGKRYEDLEDDLKGKFLSYSLPIDEFQGVTPDEVQESFLRMNSSNIPLNSEERRNAKFQGDLKWALLKMARSYRAPFVEIGLFSRNDVVRMQDVRAYAEIVSAVTDGFVTLRARNLDTLYERYDDSLGSLEKDLRSVEGAIDEFGGRELFHRKVFLRSHVFQSAVQAFLAKRGVFSLVNSAESVLKDEWAEIENLNVGVEDLYSALTNKETSGPLGDFYIACAQKTNTQENRARRFAFFFSALS